MIELLFGEQTLMAALTGWACLACIWMLVKAWENCP